MTATRSAISATTPKSWVMKTMPVSCSRLQLRDQRKDLRLRRDVEGGRRLVGDEDAGSSISAMAIMARWRSPPESSCG